MITLKDIEKITTGAVRIWQEEGAFCFSRFTEKQEQLLRDRGFHPRERGSAGIRLEFTTRGGEIAFDYTVQPGSGRKYYGVEIAVDGLGMHHVYGETVSETGSVCCTVPKSEKAVRVAVYFPNLAELRIKALSLPEDHAPCCRKRKYLALGDSITQGYDAAHPNQSYANLLADALDAQVLNQGIGGDVFCPDNLDPELSFAPDFITVAYGTNDWSKGVLTADNVKAYLDKLTGLYPDTPVFLMLPTWRANQQERREGIDLQQGRELMAGCAQGYANVRVIDCSRFVPPLPQYYYDGVLHPNDMGYLWYARALERAMQPYL